MSQRLQFPLDEKTVREANEVLWRAHPELKRRPLTTSSQEPEPTLRKEWEQAYLKAKAPQVAPSPLVLNLDAMEHCPGPLCWSLWQQIHEEVRQILEPRDPIRRNRQISAA